MAAQHTSSTGSMQGHQPDHIPLEPIDATPNDYESLSSGSSDGMSTRPRAFLIHLFRPHVRDYESMNLVLDHLGTFCDNALLEIRLNQSQDLNLTPLQMFHHAYARTTNLWPLDERVNPDLREAMRKFDWPALWNATMEERLRIRQYQNDLGMYGSCRRSGSQRWIIICAAYADLNEYAFGLDILRYLEPLPTMQAYHSDFNNFAVVPRDISGEDMHWFSRSFFPHWDQAFQLLKARHPHRYQEDARHILHAFVRQGVNVVDVFLKYWYQGSEDGLDDDFGSACERAGRCAVDRQWKVELDSPFASPGPDPLPLSIRTILARADHVRSQKTLFTTVAYLAGTKERENMHREMFRMILGSLKDWATATGQDAVVDDMIKAMHKNEDILGDTMDAIVDRDDGPYEWSSNRVTQNPLGNRPLHMPPVILHYGLPDELPELTEEPGEDIAGGQLSTVGQLDDDGYTLQLPRLGLIRRFLHRVHSIGARAYVSPWDLELVDIPLEAFGPRIVPQTVSHACKAPQDSICVICLDSYAHEESVSKKPTNNKQIKQEHQALVVQLRHRVVGIRRSQKANKESTQPMQLNSCSHVFHLACLDELLNQAYPTSGVVQCPCCRAAICTARPTRVARGWVGRIPLIGRFARG